MWFWLPEWTMPIKIIDSWVPRRPPSGVMPLSCHYEVPKWDGDLGRSNCYVPISVELGRRKVSLLNELYLSQRGRDWWDDEMFLGLMRIRGWSAGAVTQKHFRHRKPCSRSGWA